MSNLSEKPEYAPRPVWVKWLVITAIVLLLVVVIALLAGGKHGPGRHMSRGSVSNEPAAGVAAVTGNE